MVVQEAKQLGGGLTVLSFLAFWHLSLHLSELAARTARGILAMSA